MEEAIFKLLNRLTEEKRSACKFPTYTTKLEIDNAVSDALNKLYSDGRIKVGDTANGKWIEVI
jgi:hypothetical protein